MFRKVFVKIMRLCFDVRNMFHYACFGNIICHMMKYDSKFGFDLQKVDFYVNYCMYVNDMI